jgi:hypothetical protein
MCFESADVRRCRSVFVPRDLSSNVRRARNGAAIAWLAVFEDELAFALAEYAAHRDDGVPTHELADYIAYLDACVTCLVAGSNDHGALASIERFARVRNAAVR